MTLQGYTSNFADEDLIPSNIRKDKEIYGVEGDYAGGIGTLVVGKSIQSFGTTLQLPQYLSYIGSSDTLVPAWNIFYQEGNILVCGIGANQYYGAHDNYIKIILLDLITGDVLLNGGVSEYNSGSPSQRFSSIKYESGIIYVNLTEMSSPYTQYHYEINIGDLTISTKQAGGHNTGDTIGGETDITISGNTFSVSPKLNANGLYSSYSSSAQIARTGILVT